MSPVSRLRKRRKAKPGPARVEGRRLAPDGDEPRLMLSGRVVAFLEERRDATAGHHGMNGWRCGDCGLVTVCVDVHTGVTPMFLACRRTEGCQGTAVSAGYPRDPLPESLPQPGWEWYRPSAHELARLDGAGRDHVLQGGLLLRERVPS